VGLLGETAQDITADQQTVQWRTSCCRANAINLPTYFLDGNNHQFDLQPTGSINCGASCVFAAFDGSGAAKLDVIVNGQSTHLRGSSIARRGHRGTADPRQAGGGLAGLNVTRKVFVPRDGILRPFTFEILENPDAGADHRDDTRAESYPAARRRSTCRREIVTTSSGEPER